jgi:glutamyl-tRNA synthetase
MRVEDLDPQRSRPELEPQQLADLRWLGLDWDEGPDVGGPFGPYRQSQRGEVYEHALARLDVYRCTCSRREVRDAARAPHGATAVYPGTCRGGPSHPGQHRAALRVRVPNRRVDVDDVLAGRVTQDLAAEVGDFVVRRADGAWAYQLAVVADDIAMGITHVVRGSDLLESAPRQRFLFEALGAVASSFAHVPIVLGPDGAKLNKRHGAPDLASLREGGEDAERVVAALARSLDLVGPSVAAVSAAELVADFDMAAVPVEPVVLDMDALGLA